jgi:TrmH family RNA methyltransferase
MTVTEPIVIRSRDNPQLKELRRLAQENTGYRKAGRFWVEGDHLCHAALQRGLQPALAVIAEGFWSAESAALARTAARTLLVSDVLFDELSGLPSPARVGFVLDLPRQGTVNGQVGTVILDRVQDAGNVGSILRSAGAFGFRQVLALKGTAALWSPKVLRAGMGAHFGLQLLEGLELSDLDALSVPLVVTSSHQGVLVQHLRLPQPCAWALGHEGQGVCQALVERAQHFARIDQPGGEESLNVAAAAAICLYASVSQPT